ncbi:MAG: prephenate dehydrogenase/arogenate dehydrogenase family protein [Anaerolineae bacterium]
MAEKPRIAIIGLGRIGASMGLALKKANSDLEVIGHDKDSRTAQRAQKRGAVDKTEWNLLNACDGAGLIVLALPVGAIQDTLKFLSGELQPGVVVTDTASTKAPVLQWASTLLPGISFVGGDPIIPPTRAADREADAFIDAGLFQDAVYCLTPSMQAAESAVRLVSTFVSLLGAKPLFIDAQEHDGLITGAEHLPYLLAATLLHTTTTGSGWRDMSKLAGRDFQSATELAARDPVQQRHLVLHHRQDLVRWIDLTINTLSEMREALEKEDAARLDKLFGEMIDARTTWLKGQTGAAPAIDATDLKPSLSRMLLGGLAPKRGKGK